MANEITYSGIAEKYSYPFELARDNMLEAFYETAGLVLPFLKRKDIASFPSDSARFPKNPKLVASSVPDGTDLTNTPYAPTQTTLTVGEVALMLTITDMADRSSIQMLADYGREAGQAVAEKLMTDIASLGAGFSDQVSSTGTNITEANFRDAKTRLVIRRNTGMVFALLYPQQVTDLQDDIGTTLNPAALGGGGQTARGVTNDLTIGTVRDEGELYGVRVITSTEVATANAGADSAGFMAVAGRAIAHVEKWAARIEQERDASLRGTEIVAGSAYAVGEIDDDAGVALITDR